MSLGSTELRIQWLEKIGAQLDTRASKAEQRATAVEQSLWQSWASGPTSSSQPPCDFDSMPATLKWTQTSDDSAVGLTGFPLTINCSKVADLNVYFNTFRASPAPGWVSACMDGFHGGGPAHGRRAILLIDGEPTEVAIVLVWDSGTCAGETLPLTTDVLNDAIVGDCHGRTWSGAVTYMGGAGGPTVTIAEP